jgi:hypothetical protein
VEPFASTAVNGFDDIGLTLRHADKIRAFEAERLTRQPCGPAGVNHPVPAAPAYGG